MTGNETIFLPIIIDVIIGIVLGGFAEKIEHAVYWAAAGAFCFSLFAFAFGNPESLTHVSITETNEKITIIVYATINFVVNLLFVEISALPSNLIAKVIRQVRDGF